MHNRITLKEY